MLVKKTIADIKLNLNATQRTYIDRWMDELKAVWNFGLELLMEYQLNKYYDELEKITGKPVKRVNRMTIVNATPHKITILANQNIEQDAKQQFLANPEAVEILTEIPPSGLIARVSITNYPVEDIDGIPLQSVIYGDIQGLPEYEKGVYYIVSGLVAQAASKIGRKDCLAPGALVRQKDNPSVILGCLFLQKP